MPTPMISPVQELLGLWIHMPTTSLMEIFRCVLEISNITHPILPAYLLPEACFYIRLLNLVKDNSVFPVPVAE